MNELANTLLSALVGGLVGHYGPKLVTRALSRHVDISGYWSFIVTTQETSYRPFEDMRITYLAMLETDGLRISGSGEKDYENSASFIGRQEGEDRSQIVIDGRMKPRPFRTPRVSLTIREVGRLRESTVRHDLELEKTAGMAGKFQSTVAKQRGDAHWLRQSS